MSEYIYAQPDFFGYLNDLVGKPVKIIKTTEENGKRMAYVETADGQKLKVEYNNLVKK